ncbi:Isoflavone reductase p3 [Globisporangium polare]
MVAYTSFAVIGAGSLGTHVVNELLKRKVALKVLTRDDTKPEFAAFKENGASVVKVDYSNEDELKRALADVQVLGLDAQIPIAKVAKAAGVRLFVPAEYGIYIQESFTRHKKDVHDALKALDLPYTVFYTDAAFSVTSRHDIARFVAHTLTTAEPSDLAWAKIPAEADRKTHHEIAAVAQKKLGKHVEIEYVDVEETRKEFFTKPPAFFTTVMADGNAVAGSKEDVQAAISKFFPDWNPTPLEAFIVE